MFAFCHNFTLFKWNLKPWISNNILILIPFPFWSPLLDALQVNPQVPQPFFFLPFLNIISVHDYLWSLLIKLFKQQKYVYLSLNDPLKSHAAEAKVFEMLQREPFCDKGRLSKYSIWDLYLRWSLQYCPSENMMP